MDVWAGDIVTMTKLVESTRVEERGGEREREIWLLWWTFANYVSDACKCQSSVVGGGDDKWGP